MVKDIQNLPIIQSRDEPEQFAHPPFGLYIHIPFCRRKCNYCAFISAPPKNDAALDRYIRAVCAHLQSSKEIVENQPFTSVYIGGGTPSLLGKDRLKPLFETIQETFSIQSGAEFTLEANPESATEELFRELIPLGLNRVSLGAQSFHEEELKKLGRIHSAGDTKQAVEYARNAGIANLSLDLIFAIPNQTLEKWQESLSAAVECQPNHISAYGFSFEEGTILDQWRDRGKASPVLDETYISMYDWTCQYLSEQGWIHYEISNWSQSGKESRHNRIYWNRDNYLAAGAAAHGMIGGYRYSIIRDAGFYTEILENEGFSPKSGFWHPNLIEEKIELTSEEMASDAMIFGLRQIEGISISRFQRRFGYSPAERWGKSIRALCDRRWMEQSGDMLRLTKQTIPISNEVFIHFLD